MTLSLMAAIKKGDNVMYEHNGKIYSLEEVKDFWREHSFVCYNDRDFYEWLEKQTMFKEVK